MVKSIRWTLQLWHAALLTAVLSGVGIASYYGMGRLRYEQVDASLTQSAQIMSAGLRVRPPPRGPGPQDGNPMDFRGRGRPNDFNGRPNDFNGRGPPDRGPDRGPQRFGQGPSTRPNGGPPVEIPPNVAQRFDAGGPDSLLYCLIWSQEGQLLRAIPATIRDVPDPGPRVGEQAWQRDPEPPVLRQRGDFREAFLYGPFGTRLLVGTSIAPLRAEMHRTALLLAAAGAGVLIIGLGGGWLLSQRAVRPIHAITAAAQEISASNLSRRIDVAGTQSELGTLASVLNDTFARLETAFQQQVRFTADASHELRTPLAVMHTNAQLALSRERTVAEYQKMFQTCLRASERMKNLVDSLLLLARADAGRLSLNCVKIDLRDIVKDCTEMLTPLAASKSVTIQADLPSAELTADASRLAQVATNLLTNAIRYNREGGRVQITLANAGEEIVLTIADTGVGIASEQQKSLFERFYRVDVARSREDGGSGLGLSICKTIVEAHGGSISFQSEIGKGSTFVVRLPRHAKIPPEQNSSRISAS